MGSYTKIDERAAQEILNLYGKGTVQQLTPLSLGISNSNYKVETSQKESWLLKISNDKGQEQLAAEQKILLFLKKNHYPYSLAPERLLSGEVIYQYQEYFGVVYPFIQGIPPGPSDQTCFAIGQALAKLHSLSVDSASLRNHEEVGFGAKEIANYCQQENCPQDFRDDFQQILAPRLESFYQSRPTRTLIHGDLYYDNTLFHNDQLAVVLDFEQAGIGEALLDMGICISGTCLEKSYVSPPLIRSFLTGYQTIRPLNQTERELLDTSILLGLFSIALWRIKRFKEGELNQQMANSYQELTRRASLYYQLIQADF